MSSERISPTAHYTGWVWYANGLSHPALATHKGRAFHAALWPVNRAYERFGARPSLDAMLLARHRVIDHLLTRAIRAGTITQVVEVAAGMSPRGLRFAQAHPEVTYVETDLPHMVARKLRALDDAGLRGANHHVVPLDALADDGSESLRAVFEGRLDRSRGVALITEGLLGYFDRANVVAMWNRFARALGRHPRGLYLSDLHLAGETGGMRSARAFRVLLSAFARGKTHLHFADARDAASALRDAGFARATLHRAGDFAGDVEIPYAERGHTVRLVEAWT